WVSAAEDSQHSSTQVMTFRRAARSLANHAEPVACRADALRGRLFLRRLSQPNMASLTARQYTPRAADGSVKVVDPSDRGVTYRMPFGIATTPRSALVRTPRNFSSKKAAAVRARADDPFMGDTIRRQLGEADLILLSKCDVPAPADLAATEAWLASEALTAAVVPMTATTPPPRAVLFDLAAPAPWRHGGTDTLGHDQAYDSLILTPPPALDAD
ncbi:MAG: hypothetical protein QGF33_13670, partial [Alphaproteobacteria bacterium]|nr:hypothetical protein [Alphaproteobacteria bacterium]